jgi:hypothetical protein
MKHLFFKPIGTIRELGTPRQWTGDAIGWLIIAAAILVAWIVL